MPVKKDYYDNLLDKINYTVFPARLKTNLDAGKGISFNEDEVIIDIPCLKKRLQGVLSYIRKNVL